MKKTTIIPLVLAGMLLVPAYRDPQAASIGIGVDVRSLYSLPYWARQSSNQPGSTAGADYAMNGPMTVAGALLAIHFNPWLALTTHFQFSYVGARAEGSGIRGEATSLEYHPDLQLSCYFNKIIRLYTGYEVTIANQERKLTSGIPLSYEIDTLLHGPLLGIGVRVPIINEFYFDFNTGVHCNFGTFKRDLPALNIPEEDLLNLGADMLLTFGNNFRNAGIDISCSVVCQYRYYLQDRDNSYYTAHLVSPRLDDYDDTNDIGIGLSLSLTYTFFTGERFVPGVGKRHSPEELWIPLPGGKSTWQ